MTKHAYRMLAAAAALAAGLPQAANASIIFAGAVYETGQGFGNNPRILTTQETGPRKDGVESGCVAVGSGGILIGPGNCISDALVFMGNGVTNTAGDEPNPLADNQKYGIPTISELGWQNASDIGLLFNTTDPGGNGVIINDVTLKFFNGTTVIAAIDGNHTFASTEPGNGVAGYGFIVDAQQQAYLNANVFALANFGNIRISLENTITNAQGGPDSWLAYNLGNSIPEPASWALMIAGFTLVGGALRRRRSAPRFVTA